MEAILSNHTIMKSALLIVGIAGMAMCSGGIGKVALANRWGDPGSIISYVLGAAALGIIAASLAGWRLPFITTEWHAIVAVLLIIAIKLGISAIHSLP